jgi:hypothetical protein
MRIVFERKTAAPPPDEVPARTRWGTLLRPIRFLARHWKVITIVVLLWYTVAQTISFPTFIVEEAYQTGIQFAVWMAQDAGRQDLVAKISAAAEEITVRGQRMTRWLWMHPFAQSGYDAYFNIAAPLMNEAIAALAAQGNSQQTMASSDTATWSDPLALFGQDAITNSVRWSDVASFMGVDT